MCAKVLAERFLPVAFNIGVNDGKAAGQFAKD
jgi:diadenosine tetraphosphate (Ap4A) HIT family hydrolase